jgi:hypothetical protein
VAAHGRGAPASNPGWEEAREREREGGGRGMARFPPCREALAAACHRGEAAERRCGDAPNLAMAAAARARVSRGRGVAFAG